MHLDFCKQENSTKTADWQWKSTSTTVKATNITKWFETATFNQIIQPIFCCLPWLCQTTLLKSLARDSMILPFQITKDQGRLLLKFQKTAHLPLSLSTKLKATISNKQSTSLWVLLQGIKESTRLPLAYVTSFWAKSIRYRNIAKKTGIGGTSVNNYISKISSVHCICLISCQLHFLLIYFLCNVEYRKKKISAFLANK